MKDYLTLTNFVFIASLVLVSLGIVNVAAFIAVTAVFGLEQFLVYKKGQLVQGAMKTLLDNQRIQAAELKALKDKMSAVSVKAGIGEGIADLGTRMRRL